MHFNQERRNQCYGPPLSRLGFSLVELLVVIGIISVLIAVLTPTVNWAILAGARAKCASNLRQIGSGWCQYVVENKGRLPVSADDNRTMFAWSGDPVGIGQVIQAGYLPELKVKYTDNGALRGIYGCPGLLPMKKFVGGGDQGTYAVDPRNGRFRVDIGGPSVNYAYSLKAWDLNRAKRAQLVCCHVSAHGFTPNVMYLDGHVQNLSPDQAKNSYASSFSFDKLDLP